MKIRRARIDGGVSPCAATPENIGKKRCCHIADMASRATLSVLTAIALTACTATNGGATVPTETTPIESAGPTETTAESVQTTETTQVAPTNETTEETVYIYGGRYYHQGDPAIEGKSVEAMTLSDAQNAGYTDGATMTSDEQCAYDYNLAYDMMAQGYSDADIKTELLNKGYENTEEAADFLISWVRDDFNNGTRAYESSGTPYTPSTGVSGSGSSGSGSSGSGNSGSGNSGSGNRGSSGGSSLKVTHQQPTETQEPAPTQPTPTEPAPTEPAPTETQAPTPTPVPTETQAPIPTPVPPTPTPTPQVTGYRLTGIAWEDMGKGARVELTFEGSSKSDVINQCETYCENHNMLFSGYSIATIYG